MAKYKAMSAKKKSQVRSADPHAIRATVYFPADLHAAMTLATEEARKLQRAERVNQKGPREYSRITMSAVIVEACSSYIATYYPKFRAKPKRKAA